MSNKMGMGKTMVATHPGRELRPVEAIAKDRELSTATLAGLRRATGWAPGKQVTDNEFDQALEQMNQRPMGSGRL